MLAIYALCVWPANFKQAFGHECDVLANPEADAEVILSHQPMAVLLEQLMTDIYASQTPRVTAEAA